ncbi:MAG: ORF6N domain-containing protein [Parcubacteria group bacterium]
MQNKKKNSKIMLVPEDVIEGRIYFIRGRKAMLDSDLAKLYGVELKALNQAVKRNVKRFPDDFMFQLSKEENDFFLRSQFVTLEAGKYSKYLPYVFTEPGIAMLSSVLNSEKAIQVNIQIIRTFIKIREMIISNSELRAKIELLEKKFDGKFHIVFEAINKILSITKEDIPVTKRIGFDDKKAK